PPQVHSNKLRLAASEVPGFIFLWCLGAQRKGMVISMRHFWRNTLLLMAAAALFLTAALAADGTEEQCPQPTNVRIITEPTVISVTQWDGNVAPMTFYPGSLIWDDMGDAYTYYIEYFRR